MLYILVTWFFKIKEQAKIINLQIIKQYNFKFSSHGKYHLKKEYYSFHKLKGLCHNFQP